MPFFARGNYYRIVSGESLIRFDRHDVPAIIESGLVVECNKCRMPAQGIFYAPPRDYHPVLGTTLGVIEGFLMEKGLDYETTTRDEETKYLGSKFTADGND